MLKYVGSVINLANGFSQATRPAKIGQLSDLIQEYRNSTDIPTESGWETFYFNRMGTACFEDAVNSTWNMFHNIRENTLLTSKLEVKGWMHDLIINKTFEGLQIQLDILETVAMDTWRLATPEEEAKGIDGYVDGEPVSIKPHSYKKTLASKKENIPYKIIFYRKSKNGYVCEVL